MSAGVALQAHTGQSIVAASVSASAPAAAAAAASAQSSGACLEVAIDLSWLSLQAQALLRGKGAVYKEKLELMHLHTTTHGTRRWSDDSDTQGTTLPAGGAGNCENADPADSHPAPAPTPSVQGGAAVAPPQPPHVHVPAGKTRGAIASKLPSAFGAGAGGRALAQQTRAPLSASNHANVGPSKRGGAGSQSDSSKGEGSGGSGKAEPAGRKNASASAAATTTTAAANPFKSALGQAEEEIASV